MKRALVVAGALLLSVGAGIAQQDLVKQDQTVMKGNGKAMGAVLGPMVKGEKPYDQAAVDEALKQLDSEEEKSVPGKLKAIALVERVFAADESDRMPQKK